MSIFGKIKNAIFGGDDAPQKGAAPQAGQTPSRPQAAPNFPKTKITYAEGARPRLSEVDVEQRLDGMEGADRLNWRTSVVDLMKLIGVDPSYENRKELAQELGDTDYSGKAEENIWLHKRVMQELAKNGGKVPSTLTD